MPTTDRETTTETFARPVPSSRPEPIEAKSPASSPHALILAGGDGVRVRKLTRTLTGDDRPKQFCSLLGADSLLAQTRSRAALVVPSEQIHLVLTRRHEPYYREIVANASAFSLVVQPEARGTAPAVLYGLLRIASRTTKCPVVILPSDHWVSDEAAFMAHVAAAVEVVEARPDLVVLLGIEPTRAETDYGWIVPSESIPGPWPGLRHVRRFVEKPAPDLARVLQAQHSLWSSSVVVGQLEALFVLFARGLPKLVDSFLSIWNALGSGVEDSALRRLYGGLTPTDFSRDVLAVQPQALSVMGVTGVIWEDVGDPVRVLAARKRASESRFHAPDRRWSPGELLSLRKALESRAGSPPWGRSARRILRPRLE